MSLGFLLEAMIFEIMIMGLDSTLHELCIDVWNMNFYEELS